VQDIAVLGTVRRDVNTFFGKSYAHKAKDGRQGMSETVKLASMSFFHSSNLNSQNYRKKGLPSQIVSDTSTCRCHLAFCHAVSLFVICS
jgi:hypothetical protein